MRKLTDLSIDELAGYSYDCSCGRKHSVDIKKISIGNEIYKELPAILSEFKQKKIFIIADNNTYIIYGKKVLGYLEEKGFRTASHVFDSRGHLVPNEEALGRLLVEIDSEVGMIVAVGSGSINDISRMISFKLGIPYIIVGTAPSMDGYASTVSPLIISGFKKTFEAVYPYAILAEMEVLTAAPKDMICAGFGDILGKLTALTDWRLSRKINNEYYCQACVEMVELAIKKCIDNAKAIDSREPEAIGYLMEALILSGVVMGMVGNSRPASGSEHHLSHYWEIDALARGVEHPLHGNSVGVGTVIISSIYKRINVLVPLDFELPTPEYVIEQLKNAGSICDPKTLGIEKEVFRNSVIHAKEIRPRYTVLQLAQDKGVLEKVAEELTELYYGK